MWTAEKTPTTQERETELIRASERYMRGELTPDQFHEVERRLRVDYRAAARSIAKARRISRQLAPA